MNKSSYDCKKPEKLLNEQAKTVQLRRGRAQPVLVSFLVPVFPAVIGTQLVFWLERKRFPSVVAVLIGRERARWSATSWYRS